MAIDYMELISRGVYAEPPKSSTETAIRAVSFGFLGTAPEPDEGGAEFEQGLITYDYSLGY